MKWEGRRQSTNVIDQRHLPPLPAFRRWLVTSLTELIITYQQVRHELERWRGAVICTELTFSRPVELSECEVVAYAMGWEVEATDRRGGTIALTARSREHESVVSFLGFAEGKLSITSSTTHILDWGRQEEDVLAVIRILIMLVGPLKWAAGVPVRFALR